MARPPRTVRQLELGVAAVRSLGSQGGVGTNLPHLARSRPGMAAARQHSRSRPPRCSGRKKGAADIGQEGQALGRSRGGFSTKLHVAVNGLGLPVELQLTPGQQSDFTQAEALLERYQPAVVIADKGYDSDALIDSIRARGADAVIPPRKNRTEAREYDRHLYKDRNLVERFVNRIKRCRRVATRYEKTARNYLAFVQVAAIMVL